MIHLFPLRYRIKKKLAELISERCDIVLKKNSTRQMHSTELVKLIIRENRLREDINLLTKLLYK